MNRQHTFQNVTDNKKSSLVNELDEGDEEKDVGVLRKPVDGEEEEGDDKFNEAGEVIEPFNLRDERDSGHFDENMNFVFQKEKGEIDAWLADMDEAAMEQGIGEAAKALRIRQEKISQAEEVAKTAVKKSEMELKVDLLQMMIPGENVVQAMRRLSGNQSNNGSKIKKRGVKKDIAEVKALTQSEILANRAALEKFTEIADELLSTGLSGVYDMTYDSIEASSVRWEYRGLDGVIHGPYTPQEIVSWKSQGYFTGPSAVMMRKVGIVGKTLKSVVDNSNAVSSAARGGVEEIISVGSKVKFQFGANSEEPSMKKLKPENEKEVNENEKKDEVNDLMDDLEGDDGDEEAAVATTVEVASVSKESAIDSIAKEILAEETIKGVWISSDEIDFGVDAASEKIDELDENDDEDDEEA
mmetsp:Transcript_28729/g.27517  ORF Transcript_28729/g.27517 Transcript_28729/m.27517 type:complete len:413 (+) Transcript_28729:77-1315(+)|eukprot:CAMPEP_0119036088 /NCGR_PEP_ID=MMETSP1177-20130426/3556_1 /TAXON_ID=2985 /ORGANISM="Ochromonas sp, Strain CCMP1899" /LENGTH=412 /DNA_ID=CAMNT_0006995369 /DNA_START=43 /DNA_END=1281 /DNA_ORIENTATION=-